MNTQEQTMEQRFLVTWAGGRAQATELVTVLEKFAAVWVVQKSTGEILRVVPQNLR